METENSLYDAESDTLIVEVDIWAENPVDLKWVGSWSEFVQYLPKFPLISHINNYFRNSSTTDNNGLANPQVQTTTNNEQNKCIICLENEVRWVEKTQLININTWNYKKQPPKNDQIFEKAQFFNKIRRSKIWKSDLLISKACKNNDIYLFAEVQNSLKIK